MYFQQWLHGAWKMWPSQVNNPTYISLCHHPKVYHASGTQTLGICSLGCIGNVASEIQLCCIFYPLCNVLVTFLVTVTISLTEATIR